MDDDADVVRRKKNSIKKPKTSRYPSLKGTDPKFRRNHRYALHGTMKALVSTNNSPSPPPHTTTRARPARKTKPDNANNPTEGAEGGQA